MNYKILVLTIMALVFVYELLLHYLSGKSAGRPIPDNVSDVYDAKEYQTWLRYYAERNRLSLWKHLVSSAAGFLLIGLNVYAFIHGVFGVESPYGSACIIVLAECLISQLWELPFSYAMDMGVEQRYGFNRMTKGVFVSDAVKNLIIGCGLSCGLVCCMIALHRSLGGYFVIAFVAVGLAFTLVLTFLSPLLTRIFNKLTPLEEGELRTKLMQLLQSNDCQVRNIYVMDGSKRSTKANAFFSGFGKTKTIALYDTLIQQLTPDEIVAVFAHEMGHNKHKDTLKLTAISMANFLTMGLLLWVLLSVPEVYSFFGFAGMNYGFAYVLLGVCLGALNPLLQLLQNVLSRKFEYAADGYAADRGYGQALCSGLKKLEKNGFGNLNPHPVLVKLYYSHPTTSQRIEKLFEK